ncbi:MAG: hypothetical protein KKD99_12735 [Proteobacteria bacterium]|nr:hypothetical protein [Pseudomonadota bacterium]MBU4354144.1 hypothetical protein [Pseudomonadota bacterium]MBU4449444.1 hypothetical protein [Pseudomonadota bacterium]MCG2772127.1 hypothetical protein [Desulfobacterales bacterium]
MKPDQSLGVGSDEPSPLRPHPVSFSRARGGLSLLLLAFCLSLVFLGPALAADGALDPSFNAGVGPLNGVQAIPELRGQVNYPTVTGSPLNGYSLIFGEFYGISVGVPFQARPAIARLTNTGALDTTFNNAQTFGEIRSVYIYPADDPNFPNKILIGGNFFASSGTYYSPRFARLNADGSLDTTFPQTFIGEGAVNSIAVQGSGTAAKILVGGWSMLPSELDFVGPFCSLVRFNYNGTLDSTYTPWSAPGGYINDIRVNDPLFPGDVLIFCSYPKNPAGSGGNYYMLRLNPALNLSSPLAFIGDETVDGPIFSMARQSDGNYVICGQFQKVYNPAAAAWVSRNRVARLGSDLRTLDTFYSVGVGPNDMVEQISPMSSSDDRMVLAGNFSTWNGAPRGYLVRLNANGTLDTNFPSGGSGADDRIMRVNWFSDGSGGLIYGYFRSYNGQPRRGIAGLNADGSLNGAFASVTPFPGGPGMVSSLATQSDGKIIIGGPNFNGVGGKYRGGFARLNPDGSLDTSFKSGVNGWVEGVALQADGKILVAGNFGQCQGYARHGLARLNPDGSLDTAFNLRLGAGDDSGSIVHQVVPLSNGQLMITGYLTGPAVRLNSDGTLDPSFDASSFSIPGSEGLNGRRLAVVGDKYVVAGTYNEFSNGFLVRLTPSGAVDPDFGPSNTPPLHIQTMDGSIEDLLLQPDGKIVVSGGFSHIIDGSVARPGIARFSANGLLDNTFTPSLVPPLGANTIVLTAMARQPNGKILIEQNFLNDNTFVSAQIARLNSNGSLDPSFILGNPANGGYWRSAGNSILRLPSGKALIGGNFSSYNGTPAWSLVRIFAGPANFSPGALYLLLGN